MYKSFVNIPISLNKSLNKSPAKNYPHYCSQHQSVEFISSAETALMDKINIMLKVLIFYKKPSFLLYDS